MKSKHKNTHNIGTPAKRALFLYRLGIDIPEHFKVPIIELMDYFNIPDVSINNTPFHSDMLINKAGLNVVSYVTNHKGTHLIMTRGFLKFLYVLEHLYKKEGLTYEILEDLTKSILIHKGIDFMDINYSNLDKFLK